jgi:hypothetical protein
LTNTIFVYNQVVEFIFLSFEIMQNALDQADQIAPSADQNASQAPDHRTLLTHFKQSKIAKALMGAGAALSLGACIENGNTATVQPQTVLTLAQVAQSGVVMNTMVAAGQNTTASITPSPAVASQIAAVYCLVNNSGNTRVFPDANGTYTCNVQSFNQNISQNIGDNSVTFDVYPTNPNGGYGAKTSVVQPFSVDATGTVTMGQPTVWGIATPTISSVPSTAGLNGVPSMDVPFTAIDANGVSCVQAFIDRPSAVPPMSAVGGTWTLPAASGFTSSVTSSVPVAMPTGTVPYENINIILKVRDRLGNVTSNVVPATTY